MHKFLCRLFFYVLTFGFLNTIFNNWPEPLPGSTLGGRIGFYLGYYGVLIGIWTLILEGLYRAFRPRRRPAIEDSPTKDLAVPETNRLDRK